MGFSQVVEENGIKKLAPITTPTSVTAQEAKTLALEAKELAEAALPLNGSKAMTGTITRNLSNAYPGATIPDNGSYDGARVLRLLGSGGAGDFGGISTEIWNSGMVALLLTYKSCLLRLCTTAADDKYLEGALSFAGEVPARALIIKQYADERYLQKLAADRFVEVGGANASDTADLNAGRGGAGKPFATLPAAAAWACSALGGAKAVIFRLHANMTLTAPLNIYAAPIQNLRIMSDDTKRTLTLGGPIQVYGGSFTIEQVKLEAGAELPHFLLADGQQHSANCIIGAGVEMSGVVSNASIYAANGGHVFLGADIAGEVTGKKYSCVRGGRIISNNHQIPGTDDGTYDGSSTVI